MTIFTGCYAESGRRARREGCFFFFQAEDGIRDLTVTGVQTCALPICGWPLFCDALYGATRREGPAAPPAIRRAAAALGRQGLHAARLAFTHPVKIGRASGRERV